MNFQVGRSKKILQAPIILKTLVLAPIAFILCNCASHQPNSGAAGLASSQGAEQQTSTMSGSGSEPTETNSAQPSTDGSSLPKNDTQPDPTVATSEVNSDMEEVEVVGTSEKQHCTIERRTGTRIRKKYCRTVKEDETQRAAAQAWINTLKNKPQGNSVGRE